ncbi:hypothetical protein MJI20_30855, partial [Salmonella enterica subsp. enterica serovar Anatum]|nr:hypothetical protein [Salmonella enterica subsp. enterica serovar Anatum]
LMFMFVRFVHHNIPDKKDIPWLKNIVEVLKGNEHKVADVGKYEMVRTTLQQVGVKKSRAFNRALSIMLVSGITFIICCINPNAI